MLDILWIIICAVLVLIMQAGFTCLETGLVRNKNSINVAIKNLMDLCVSGAIFWLIGYGLMFGTSYNGLIGIDQFLFSVDQSPLTMAFFFYQLMFCGTAITIISGAVAERMSFVGYMTISVLIACFIYPVIGHWVWAGALDSNPQGWLGKIGFIDFAGSTVVHSLGGWCALAAVIIIGPRLGRYTEQDKIQGSSLPLSVLGTILLWIGWFGFNGGSTLAMNETVPLIFLNTCLAAIFGGISTLVYLAINKQNFDVSYCINGILGGLVSITASCHLVEPHSAVLIGVTAGIIVSVGTKVLNRYQIDDLIGAVPVHLFAGIWGTLIIPFLSDPADWNSGFDRWQQFLVQLTGVISVGLYAFGLSYILFRTVNYFKPLRVSAEAERQGLNISEHKVKIESVQLLGTMLRQEKTGDFSHPVEVEPFTEVGQIATQYNKVLARVDAEITVREEALKAYEQSESRKGAILNAALDSIITIDTEGVIREFNLAAEKCFGLSAQHVLDRNFIDLFVPMKSQDAFIISLSSHFSINNQLALNKHNRITLRRLHEMEFPAELSITQVDLNKRGFKEFTFHIRDETKRLEIQNKMHKLAFHDALTGLYNRTFFFEKLTQEIDFSNLHRRTVSLMFLDLDQFKAINDSMGHNVGDQLLQHIASHLQKTVGNNVVCRWGGDEFIIMFTDLFQKEKMIKMAEAILKMSRALVVIHRREIRMEVSIGIAISMHGTTLADQLVQQADMAMYEAKQKGKNTYCFFHPSMEEKVKSRFYYESELRKAIKKDQFRLFYQPKVDCKQGGVVGFEALLRWNHPEKGLVPPSVFIPILEESTLINDVTDWLVQTVCRQLKEWQDKNLKVLPVAINLSAKDFLVADCFERISNTLQKNDVEGDLLELEITETMLATNVDQCISLMKRFKQIGIRFSVDDFGTGYSSMSYLKKFPIDTLKIDQEFIRECHDNKESAAICQAIIVLGKSLGLTIIAEGVETELQLDFLQLTACDAYQGFLFSRPVPPEEIEILLARKG